MDKMRVEIVAERGAPLDFFEKGKMYADAIRFAFSHLEEHIVAYDGYVTLKYRKDGNCSIQAHCTDRITLDEMDKIIALIAPSA